MHIMHIYMLIYLQMYGSYNLWMFDKICLQS